MKLEVDIDATEQVAEHLRILDAQRYTISQLIPTGFESIFRKRAQYANAHSSAKIEGNRLGFSEAIEAISSAGEPQDADSIEVRQLNEAYEHAYHLTSGGSFTIDEGTIRALNSVLQRGSREPAAATRGAYRSKPVGVKGDAPGEIAYVAPPPEHVPELMRNFEESLARWLRASSDHLIGGVVAAASAHFSLVSIHPFEDGNGRTARLISDMVLDLSGWSFDRMISIHRCISARRDEYIEVLRTVQGPTFVETVDITLFVEFQLRCLRSAADELQAQAVSFARMTEQTAGMLASHDEYNPAQAMRTARVMAYVMLVGPISSGQYAELNDCSQATATNDLRQLVKFGGLEREGAGRNTRYVPSRRLLDNLRVQQEAHK